MSGKEGNVFKSSFSEVVAREGVGDDIVPTWSVLDKKIEFRKFFCPTSVTVLLGKVGSRHEFGEGLMVGEDGNRSWVALEEVTVTSKCEYDSKKFFIVCRPIHLFCREGVREHEDGTEVPVGVFLRDDACVGDARGVRFEYRGFFEVETR